jgi:hypothetical protein
MGEVVLVVEEEAVHFERRTVEGREVGGERVLQVLRKGFNFWGALRALKKRFAP